MLQHVASNASHKSQTAVVNLSQNGISAPCQIREVGLAVGPSPRPAAVAERALSPCPGLTQTLRCITLLLFDLPGPWKRGGFSSVHPRPLSTLSALPATPAAWEKKVPAYDRQALLLLLGSSCQVGRFWHCIPAPSHYLILRRDRLCGRGQSARNVAAAAT